MENLWANSDYNNDYLCYLQRMLDEGFDATTMQSRIDELADLIRTDVYADANKMYSNSQFEQNLYSNIQDGMDTIYGLRNFVQQRAAYMSDRLDDFVLDCPDTPSVLVGTLFINEFMADNDTTIEDPDEPGAYEDWIEIFNAGSFDCRSRRPLSDRRSHRPHPVADSTRRFDSRRGLPSVLGR